jgi:cytochrome c peroxidase
MNRSLRLACALALLTLASQGCRRAARYPALTPAVPEEAKTPALPPHWAWLPVEPRPDVPLVFVPETSPEWKRLPKFWNHFPPAPAGMRTVHLGLLPLQAAAALTLADTLETVKIKVPLGLPDPRPLLPEANPPTLGRWQLGKKLFSDPVLQVGADSYACATCHDPRRGFTQPRDVAVGSTRNTLSLINVVYNRSQFWDGRVGALEETLVRALTDEKPADESDAPRTHRWGGLVATLAGNAEYRQQFRRVFGIAQPTQDASAKALATYLRTLLCGDALVDEAERERRQHEAPVLLSEHFLPFLAEKAMQALEAEKMNKGDVARQLARGAALFHGKAGCVSCHGGPLFTDRDFHNIGLGERDSTPPAGAETGRFAVVPIGLKESRLIGAFRTPTLRALPRTAPYFHDGKRRSLREVVAFFALHVDVDNPYLAPALRARAADVRLDFDVQDSDALVLFLNALDGRLNDE